VAFLQSAHSAFDGKYLMVHTVQLLIIHFLRVQCNVPLVHETSVIAGLLMMLNCTTSQSLNHIHKACCKFSDQVEV